MNKLLRITLTLVFAAAVFAQTAGAADWGFHITYPEAAGGNLWVWGTIDCDRVMLIVEVNDVPHCETISGEVPGDPINDIVFDYHWPPPPEGCGNEDHIKFALPGWNGDTSQWELGELPPWIDAYVEGSIDFPGVGDPTGEIQVVHIIVNPEVWLADPQPFLDSYDIVNGECDDLPGYLIGTTPIVFDPNAGPDEDPFSTTPLTGTLYLDSDITLGVTGAPIPTVSEWGLIIMTLLLLTAGTVIFGRLRRRRPATT